jgi:hypothetical protein
MTLLDFIDPTFHSFYKNLSSNAILGDLFFRLMLHSKPLPISKKKYDDLITLLDFIDPTFHSFYKNLRGIYFSDYEKLEDEDRFFLFFLNIYFGFV